MTTSEISRELNELRVTLGAHTELLGIINAQLVMQTARQEATFRMLRKLLEKHGVSESVSEELFREAFAKFAVVAQGENEQALRSVGKTRLPDSSGPEASRN